MMHIELPAGMEAAARALHREMTVYDGTIFDTGYMVDSRNELEAYRSGNLSGGSVTFCGHLHNFARGIDAFHAHLKVIERNDDIAAFCTCVADIERCKREGKVGIVAHFQDSRPIEDRLEYLRIYHALGLRIFQLTYNLQGQVGTGCCERDSGLTEFGERVVDECNRLGILIDLSHVNHQTSREAIARSKAPVAFTHVGVHAMCNAYGRNKPDDLIRAVAATGGVVGIAWAPFLVKRNPETHEVLPSTVSDVLDQMDYVIRMIGVDHVGVGSDLCNHSARTLVVPPHSSIRIDRPRHPEVFGVGSLDRYDPYPQGLDHHSGMLNITRGLMQRGYSDDDIRKVMGGNWLRLFRQVWGS
jgi:membrane dipeptidase